MASEIPLPVPVSDELIQDLICSICMCVPSEVPVITPCQHIFCGGCLSEALTRQHVCPVDRCAVAPDQVTSLQEGSLTRRIWSNIRVKCGKHTDGCAWVGAIADYRSHILGCEYNNRQSATSTHELNEELANAARINVELSEQIEELHNSIQQKNDRINQLNEQMETLRSSVQQKDNRISQLKREATSLDPRTTGLLRENYNYDRFDVVKLSQLISSRLENKPYYVNSNRIFNCVQACFRDWSTGYTDNPEHYFLDMRMLLSTCLASSWFSDNQCSQMKEWLSRF